MCAQCISDQPIKWKFHFYNSLNDSFLSRSTHLKHIHIVNIREQKIILELIKIRLYFYTL